MRINVAYWADEQFTLYSYVSIFSILKNMKKSDCLCCYFLTKFPNKNIWIIQKLKKKFDNFEIKVVSIDEKNFDNIPTSWELRHWSSAIYYRLGVDLIRWPQKILYLDCDIIVDRDISVLYQENLWNKTVWVCFSDNPKSVYAWHTELWLKENKYFNSWVMLINLDKRKDNKISKKCVDLLNQKLYKCPDQDVLNIILQDNCKWLPGCYNVQSWFVPWFFEELTSVGCDEEYYECAVKDPKIIHYTWYWKPRELLPCHPFRFIYNKYFQESLSIDILKNVQILKMCLIVFIHKIEDSLFNFDTQRRYRKAFQYWYRKFTKYIKFIQ